MISGHVSDGELPIPDRAFDELVPPELRHLARAHWSPVEVAVRAVRLLAPEAGHRILDVGAGVGKLCAVGALASAACWSGIEHQARLVEAAREIAQRLGVSARTSFVHGDAFASSWDGFDALYLYNPFEPPLFDVPAPPLERLQARLAVLRAGVRVITFNGIGGALPASFACLHREHVPGSGLELALWLQRRAAG